MNMIKSIVVVSAFLIILLSCDPALIKKQSDPHAGVDSVLFYQQADLPDPLIDAVLSETDQEVRLETTLIPPPPPVPQFRQIEGFRIQIFAGVDSLNTLTKLVEANLATEDTIYMFRDGGLYKLHVGDYPFRIEADQAKQQLKNAGYNGAWIVQTMINITKDSTAANEISPQPVSEPERSFFTIQVLALSNQSDALLMTEELKNKFGFPVDVKESSGLFKVFIGKFDNREDADTALTKIRTNGYPDAWLVY